MALTAAADKVILASRPYVEMLKLFSTNFSADESAPWGGVAVQVLSATAGDFGAANGYNVGTGVKPATITLNKHKKATFQITDVEALKDDLNPCWSQFAPVAGKAVAKQMVTDATALLTYGAADAQITVTTSTLANFTAWRALVEGQNLDPADCVLLLEPTTFANLLSVIPANVLGDGSAIKSGAIAEFLGFRAVLESPNVSKESAASTNKGVGFVVPTGAIGIAARPVRAIKGVGGDLLEYGLITDDETGCTFDQRVVVDAFQGNCNWTVECLYGVGLTKQSSNGAPGFLQLKTA